MRRAIILGLLFAGCAEPAANGESTTLALFSARKPPRLLLPRTEARTLAQTPLTELEPPDVGPVEICDAPDAGPRGPAPMPVRPTGPSCATTSGNSPGSCAGQPDGSACGADPCGGERCLAGTCIGTYVSKAGSDTNPGTRALPRSTLAGGLAQAQRLIVAGVPTPVVVRVGAGVFAEDLDTPDRVDLQGGWDATWSRDLTANVSQLEPAHVQGVRFSVPSMTRQSARMSGFTIVGAAVTTEADVTSGLAAALTIENGARPSLEDLIVTSGALTTEQAPSGFCWDCEYPDPVGSTCAVRIAGAGTNPLLRRSRLRASEAAWYGTSAGVWLTAGAALELTNATATGAHGAASFGLTATGTIAHSTLTDVSLHAASAPTSNGLNLSASDCGGLEVVRADVFGHGDYVSAARIECGDAAPVIIEDSRVGTHGTWYSTGLECASGTVDVRNSRVIGTTEGGAYSSSAMRCLSHCDCRVTGSDLSAIGDSGAASQLLGVSVDGHGTFTHNRIEGGDSPYPGPTSAIGVVVHVASNARFENNVILGGACEESSAVWVTGGWSPNPRASSCSSTTTSTWPAALAREFCTSR